MASFILNSILWSFAFYGFWHVLKLIFRTYYYPKDKNSEIYLFVGVKNGEDKIEGFLRSILFRLVYGREDLINNVIVVDLNSTDKTSEILDIISKDYSFVKFLDLKQFNDYIKVISETQKKNNL